MADRQERGIALIAVLWVIVLLAIVAASFLTGTRTDTRLARNLVDIAAAEALADAGVQCAMRSMLEQTPDGTIQRFACEGVELVADGAPDVFRFSTGEVRISVEDEGGKIDLNTASEELLRGLFLSTGLDDREVGELFDANWVSTSLS